MRNLKEIELHFMQHARMFGYMHRVAGDYAYTKTKAGDSPIIKMLSARNNKIQVFRTNKGRYEIE